jgi:hypothetical protein
MLDQNHAWLKALGSKRLAQKRLAQKRLVQKRLAVIDARQD